MAQDEMTVGNLVLAFSRLEGDNGQGETSREEVEDEEEGQRVPAFHFNPVAARAAAVIQRRPRPGACGNFSTASARVCVWVCLPAVLWPVA